MKLIGLEFRVAMQTLKQIEVCCFPLDVVFPFPYQYPYGPEANVTLHTSRGDVGAAFNLQGLLNGFNGSIGHDEIIKKYDELVAQIERQRK